MLTSCAINSSARCALKFIKYFKEDSALCLAERLTKYSIFFNVRMFIRRFVKLRIEFSIAMSLRISAASLAVLFHKGTY